MCTVVCTVVLMVSSAGALSAQMAAGRAAVIDEVVTLLERGYVDADTGRRIGAVLLRRRASGAYDRIPGAAEFAEAVTTDLRSINGDLHLSLRYATPGPGATASPAPGPPPRERNFGLGRAEILDGNIGYLEITGFLAGPGVDEAVADALRFLSRTESVIIDVRRNSGGSSGMSHLVFSHFLGAEPVPTIAVRSRTSNEPLVRQSLATVPGPRRPDAPLYVLTSQGTASAAEEFSFVLKNQKRATIVGTRTAGAGHMVTFAPLASGFTLGYSVTRVSDPDTGLEWERVGVQPDVAVPAERALPTAHAAALRGLLAATTDAARRLVLTRVLEAVAAGIDPKVMGAAQLAAWAGSYEGREISAVDGRLRYARRPGALSEELTPLGGSEFALGSLRLRFEQDGGDVRLVVEQSNGTRTSYARTAPADRSRATIPGTPHYIRNR